MSTKNIDSGGAAPKQYEDRYVAFVDILGFANIVKNSTSSSTQVERLYQALSRLSKKTAGGRLRKLGAEATNFSDTVVLSTTITVDGLLHVFEAINGFTVDLLSMNMLLRGAVVRGQLLHSKDVTFGPALIDAFLLESKTSFHPRVMIDRTVMTDIEGYSVNLECRKQFERLVTTDNHDVPYLSPFAAWHEAELAQATVERLVTLQAIIASGLLETSHAPGICEKYKWLARKLNAFVRKRGLEQSIAFIDVD